MPIYRYRCTECGAQEEHIQKFSDPPVEICGTCGGVLSKQMTAAAFHLKGGGWYKDLYASSKSGGSAEASSSSGTDAAKSSDSTSTPSAPSSTPSSTGSSTPSSSGSSTPSSSGSSSSTSTSAA